VTAAQRAALVVRDGGCAVAGCDRPPAWCEAHHLRHWLHGGPTDLANLALVCRAHHRAVHEGGWQLARAPTATSPPPHPTDHSEDTRPPRPDPPRDARRLRTPVAAGRGLPGGIADAGQQVGQEPRIREALGGVAHGAVPGPAG
jgi:hypothetical protein